MDITSRLNFPVVKGFQMAEWNILAADQVGGNRIIWAALDNLASCESGDTRVVAESTRHTWVLEYLEVGR